MAALLSVAQSDTQRPTRHPPQVMRRIANLSVLLQSEPTWSAETVPFTFSLCFTNLPLIL
jgi:hypothetical protein